MTVRLGIDPHDLWVGCFWKVSYSGMLRHKYLDLWCCLLPCVVLHIRLQRTVMPSELRSWYVKGWRTEETARVMLKAER